jgi:hypothetical protein
MPTTIAAHDPVAEVWGCWEARITHISPPSPPPPACAHHRHARPTPVPVWSGVAITARFAISELYNGASPVHIIVPPNIYFQEVNVAARTVVARGLTAGRGNGPPARRICLERPRRRVIEDTAPPQGRLAVTIMISYAIVQMGPTAICSAVGHINIQRNVQMHLRKRCIQSNLKKFQAQGYNRSQLARSTQSSLGYRCM